LYPLGHDPFFRMGCCAMAGVASRKITATAEIRFMDLTSQRMQMEWRAVRRHATAQKGLWLVHLLGTGACGLAPMNQPEDPG
jgi:hypothetical protein